MPGRDGVFFSDFYLFHHLFRGTGKMQHWLTCVDPSTLVSNYGVYTHGDANVGESRVVLDQFMLEAVEDVRVCSPKDLLRDFYSCLEQASKEIDNTAPVLILSFGHEWLNEWMNDDSIIIGAASSSSCIHMHKTHLHSTILRSNANPPLTILTSAPSGGGWVQTTALSTTALANVSEKQDQLDFAQSRSLGRFLGADHLSRATEALVMEKSSKWDWQDPECAKAKDDPTYAQLEQLVGGRLRGEMEERERPFVSFEVDEDIWGLEWRARIGVSLEEFRERWGSLRALPFSGGEDVGLCRIRGWDRGGACWSLPLEVQWLSWYSVW